jgi:hypothetical protein
VHNIPENVWTTPKRADARTLIAMGLLFTVLAASVAADAPALPTGNMTIRGRVGDSEIVITTTQRLAGAIHSLTWNGKEFIDSTDHGRQLQSASNFDAGSPIRAETFNPTEAGSRRDGDGPTSTSRLLHALATPNALQTTTQVAFWLAPEERSEDNAAKNTTRLSNHLLTKRVTIGSRDLPIVIDYDVTFSVPIGERHTLGVFEALTGYMPAEFEKFWRFNPESGELEAFSDGPGEQPWPVVLATADGGHAMGIISPGPAPADFVGPSYGRFRFVAEKVVKWNCVFRLTKSEGIPAGDYRFHMLVVVGDLETVRATLGKLCSR